MWAHEEEEKKKKKLCWAAGHSGFAAAKPLKSERTSLILPSGGKVNATVRGASFPFSYKSNVMTQHSNDCYLSRTAAVCYFFPVGRSLSSKPLVNDDIQTKRTSHHGCNNSLLLC